MVQESVGSVTVSTPRVNKSSSSGNSGQMCIFPQVKSTKLSNFSASLIWESKRITLCPANRQVLSSTKSLIFGHTRALNSSSTFLDTVRIGEV
eukprot:Awhi_evm1s11314